MTTIGQSIKALRHINKMTQAELAQKSGVDQANISCYENDKYMPKIEHLRAIANVFNVSVAVIDQRLFHDPNKNKIESEVKPIKTSDLAQVPVLSFVQAAGYEPALEPLEKYVNNYSDVSESFHNVKPGYFALTVEGDSMSPQIPNGSIVLVGGGEFPERGDVVVARLRDGQVVIKHYSRHMNIIKLESFNLEGKNFQWHCKEEPGFVQWMFPVIEAKINLRRQRWECCKCGNGNSNGVASPASEFPSDQKAAESQASYNTDKK